MGGPYGILTMIGAISQITEVGAGYQRMPAELSAGWCVSGAGSEKPSYRTQKAVQAILS